MTQSQIDLKAVFLAALDRPDGPERADFLDVACAGRAIAQIPGRGTAGGPRARRHLPHLHRRDRDRSGAEHPRWCGPSRTHRRRRRVGFDSSLPRTSSFPQTGPIAEGPGWRIGPYTIIRRLGEGGMGIVFLAEQERPVRRKVALKVIKPGMDTHQVIGRFEAEPPGPRP